MVLVALIDVESASVKPKEQLGSRVLAGCLVCAGQSRLAFVESAILGTLALNRGRRRCGTIAFVNHTRANKKDHRESENAKHYRSDDAKWLS
jgi:hypothetical protein